MREQKNNNKEELLDEYNKAKQTFYALLLWFIKNGPIRITTFFFAISVVITFVVVFYAIIAVGKGDNVSPTGLAVALSVFFLKFTIGTTLLSQWSINKEAISDKKEKKLRTSIFDWIFSVFIIILCCF